MRIQEHPLVLQLSLSCVSPTGVHISHIQEISAYTVLADLTLISNILHNPTLAMSQLLCEQYGHVMIHMNKQEGG
jgi:hypothetical protein